MREWLGEFGGIRYASGGCLFIQSVDPAEKVSVDQISWKALTARLLVCQSN
jgi:hypothetical protein